MFMTTRCGVLLAGMTAGFGLVLGQPTVTITPSPNPLVSLTLVQPPASSDPVLSSIFAGTRSVLAPLSFYLANRSSEPVVGLGVLWISVDQAGKTTSFRASSDSFGSSKIQTPVIKAGDRILVVPGGAWMSDSMLPSYSQGGHFNDIQLTANKYSGASQVTVRIDSVIMGNGEVYGSDTARFADELVARKKAAEAVVAAADAAKASGVTLDSALSSMLHPSVIADSLAAWEQRYSRSALQIPDYIDHHLRQLPAAPALRKAAAPAN